VNHPGIGDCSFPLGGRRVGAGEHGEGSDWPEGFVVDRSTTGANPVDWVETGWT
jgi:hypothetical protein